MKNTNTLFYSEMNSADYGFGKFEWNLCSIYLITSGRENGNPWFIVVVVVVILRLFFQKDFFELMKELLYYKHEEYSLI